MRGLAHEAVCCLRRMQLRVKLARGEVQRESLKGREEVGMYCPQPLLTQASPAKGPMGGRRLKVLMAKIPGLLNYQGQDHHCMSLQSRSPVSAWQFVSLWRNLCRTAGFFPRVCFAPQFWHLHPLSNLHYSWEEKQLLEDLGRMVTQAAVSLVLGQQSWNEDSWCPLCGKRAGKPQCPGWSRRCRLWSVAVAPWLRMSVSRFLSHLLVQQKVGTITTRWNSIKIRQRPAFPIFMNEKRGHLMIFRNGKHPSFNAGGSGSASVPGSDPLGMV